MTPEEAQLIFDKCFEIVLVCYMIGFGIGLIIKTIKAAIEY
jgi:hypothetical protein